MSRLAATGVRVLAGAWAAAIAAVMLASALGSDPSRAALLRRGPACPLLALTGIPCPLCGMTRATVALGHGDLSTALAAHPLAPLVLALVLAVLVSIAAGRDRWLRRGAYALVPLAALIWIVRLVR